MVRLRVYYVYHISGRWEYPWGIDMVARSVNTYDSIAWLVYGTWLERMAAIFSHVNTQIYNTIQPLIGFPSFPSACFCFALIRLNTGASLNYRQ